MNIIDCIPSMVNFVCDLIMKILMIPVIDNILTIFDVLAIMIIFTIILSFVFGRRGD